jgi:hypothetical protein
MHSTSEVRGRRATLLKNGKKEEFEQARLMYSFENLENETKELEADQLVPKTVVQVSNCSGCVFKISRKINFIKINNCEDVTFVLHSLVSIFEINNSIKIRVQVEGTANNYSIYDSRDVIITLSNESKDAQVIAGKSADIKLRLPKEGADDYVEHSLPEQFVFSINSDGNIDTKVSAI